ncbi:MAG TPA: hypothetical protein VI278_15260 [Nitrososphaeraceae archaeon]
MTRQIIIDEKQVTLDTWLCERFVDKLTKASLLVGRAGSPFVLYRNIIEDTEYAVQEEVGIVSEKYVVVEMFTYGGFLPSTFQQQYVFTLSEFPTWMMQRSHEMFFRCVNNLEEIVQ